MNRRSFAKVFVSILGLAAVAPKAACEIIGKLSERPALSSASGVIVLNGGNYNWKTMSSSITIDRNSKDRDALVDMTIRKLEDFDKHKLDVLSDALWG